MLHRVRERVMASPIAPVHASGVVSIFVAVPVAVLAAAAVVPPWHGEGPWGGGWAAAALTGAILAVFTMLAGTVWLLIADWMVEIRSRAAWATIGIVSDECSSVPVVNRADRRDHLYPRGTLDNEAVWAVLRAHRHSIPSNAVESVTDMEGTDGRGAAVRSVPSITQRASAACGAEPISTDNGCDPTHTPAVETGLRVISADSKPALQVRKALPSRVTVIATRGSKARPDCGARLAIRARRIASGSPADAWPNSYPTVRMMGLPKIISNIIVRAQGDDGLTDGERLARPKLDSDRIKSRSFRDSKHCWIKRTSGKPRATWHRQEVRRDNLRRGKAPGNRARRALARQAAREDDAAEHVAERSASLDADTVSSGRDSSDRDDTG